MSEGNDKVLTLYFTKNAETFNAESYRSLLAQRGVRQDVFIVSAESVGLPNNIIVPVKGDWPLPARIGYSFNVALTCVLRGDQRRLFEYTHLFKVDGDTVLPEDYLENLLRKHAPVAGAGSALLISVPFFVVVMGGKYPVNYCDDGYISSLSIALGAWPPKYDGGGKLKIPPVRLIPEREYAYGIEYYKWGMPLQLVVLLPVAARLLRVSPHERRSLKAHLLNLAGYASAMLKRAPRYHFYQRYARARSRHFARRLLLMEE